MFVEFSLYPVAVQHTAECARVDCPVLVDVVVDSTLIELGVLEALCDLIGALLLDQVLVDVDLRDVAQVSGTHVLTRTIANQAERKLIGIQFQVGSIAVVVEQALVSVGAWVRQ